MMIKLELPDDATVGDLIAKMFPDMYFTEKYKNLMSNYFEDIKIKRNTWDESLKESGILADYETRLKAESEVENILDKINKTKSEIADSLEFWDYSPNNNPLARDMLETLTNFWGDIKAETENT